LLLIVATEEWAMRKTTKSPGEKIVKDIKRATRKHYSSEEKIRIVLDGLRGEDSIAELCRRKGISRSSFYYDPKGETEMNLGPMRVIDKQFLETPFYGVRQMT
jgi:hypothetical protein